ncbi:MAG TPA: ATPase, T2SS/T4P/T4SS family [Candidatus Eremiobacteraeota bacterium]|nr:MAG: Twitching mobility protein [bacterium ADurb.Bin363]HPZ09926.1 ATPase, T2SS/T4P/T4SS family [Candidatus Eremiobacteraeota bacterium]
MIGRIWKRSKKALSEEKKDLPAVEQDEIKQRAKKTSVGKVQVIETGLKYKYDLKALFEILMDLRPPAFDIHLTPGFPPYFRYNGELLSSDLPPLTIEEIEDLLCEYSTREKIQEFVENKFVEYVSEIPGLTSFRANLRRENNGVGASLRRISTNSLSIDQLNLPRVYKDIARKERGLIIISGPAKSGKTTTIAALIKFISNTRQGKILVLNRTIEFISPSKKSMVINKEVGKDISSYVEGIEQAFTDDTEVIVTGEIEGIDMMTSLFNATQRGLLVISEFYPRGCVKILERIINFFPETKKEKIYSHLSEYLEAIISQVIINKKENAGKALISEVLLSTPEVKFSIKEGQFTQLPMIIQHNKSIGMQDMDDELESLLKENKITLDMARAYSISSEKFVQN